MSANECAFLLVILGQPMNSNDTIGENGDVENGRYYPTPEEALNYILGKTPKKKKVKEYTQITLMQLM